MIFSDEKNSTWIALTAGDHSGTTLEKSYVNFLAYKWEEGPVWFGLDFLGMEKRILPL